MLSESLRVPYRADDASGTILVGSVLTFLTAVLVGVWIGVLIASPPVGLAVTPVVALPSLVMRGYLLRVVYSGLRTDDAVPSFVRWGALVRAGTKSTLISAVYFLPGAVFCGLALGGGAATVISPSGFDETMQALTGVVIMISGFGLLIYGVVYLYVRPAARAVFASTGSLRAALGVRRVLRLSSTGDYLTGWLIGMGVLVGGPTVLLPLLLVGIGVSYLSPPAAFIIVVATLLVGVGLQFIVRVSAAWATGRGAADEIETIYPDATTTPSSEETDVVVAAPAGPDTDYHPEAPSAVQTGRTVSNPQPTPEKPEPVDQRAGKSETATEIPDAEPDEQNAADPAMGNRDATAAETVDQPPETDAVDQPTETDAVDQPPETDAVDQPTETDAVDQPTEAESADTDDTGFVWGVDDEQ